MATESKKLSGMGLSGLGTAPASAKGVRKAEPAAVGAIPEPDLGS